MDTLALPTPLVGLGCVGSHLFMLRLKLPNAVGLPGYYNAHKYLGQCARFPSARVTVV